MLPSFRADTGGSAGFDSPNNPHLMVSPYVPTGCPHASQCHLSICHSPRCYPCSTWLMLSHSLLLPLLLQPTPCCPRWQGQRLKLEGGKEEKEEEGV